MTLIHTYDGTDLTQAVQLGDEKGFSARAVLGEADTVNVIVDDPAMTLAFRGRKVWSMRETDCPTGSQVVWWGYVDTKRISHGSGTTFPWARRWAVSLVEGNAALGRRVLVADNAKRPAETASARLTWLLTTPGYWGIIADHGLVEPSTLLMDPVDYRGRTGADVLRDLATATGYNFFIRWREASNDLELIFRDEGTSALDVSPVRLSDVPADVDSVTTWPAGFADEAIQNPERVASGIYLPYTGGSVYVSSAATAAAFAPIDLVAPSANVTDPATAAAIANRLLFAHAEEDERLMARVRLPSANLNDLRHGQRIEARRIHLPGWESFRPARVVSKSFSRPPNLSQAAYDVDLELAPVATGGIVQVASAASNQLVSVWPTFAKPTVPGDLLIGWFAQGDDPDGYITPPPGWAVLGPVVFADNHADGTPDAGTWIWKVVTPLDGVDAGGFPSQTVYGFPTRGAALTLWEIDITNFSPADAEFVGSVSLAEPAASMGLGEVPALSATDVVLLGLVVDIGNPFPSMSAVATVGSGWVVDRSCAINNNCGTNYYLAHPWHVAAHWGGGMRPLTGQVSFPPGYHWGGGMVRIRRR